MDIAVTHPQERTYGWICGPHTSDNYLRHSKAATALTITHSQTHQKNKYIPLESTNRLVKDAVGAVSAMWKEQAKEIMKLDDQTHTLATNESKLSRFSCVMA